MALRGCIHTIRDVLVRTPQLPTFDRCAPATSIKEMPAPLHGLALLDIEDTKQRLLKTPVLLAMWGPSRTARAKDILSCLLTPGHHTSPVMCTRYERAVTLARTARRSGAKALSSAL